MSLIPLTEIAVSGLERPANGICAECQAGCCENVYFPRNHLSTEDLEKFANLGLPLIETEYDVLKSLFLNKDLEYPNGLYYCWIIHQEKTNAGEVLFEEPQIIGILKGQCPEVTPEQTFSCGLFGSPDRPSICSSAKQGASWCQNIMAQKNLT